VEEVLGDEALTGGIGSAGLTGEGWGTGRGGRGDFEEIEEGLELVLGTAGDDGAGDFGGESADVGEGTFVGRLEIDAFLAGGGEVGGGGVDTEPGIPGGAGGFGSEPGRGDAPDHEEFADGLERTVPGQGGWVARGVEIGFGTAGTGEGIGVAPIDDGGSDVEGHAVEAEEFVGGSGVEIEAGGFVLDAELIRGGGRRVKDAVAAGAESDVLEEFGCVFELGGEMAIGATALEEVG